MNSKSFSLLILFLLSFSEAQITINKVNKALKCILDNKNDMDKIVDSFEIIFSNGDVYSLIGNIVSLIVGAVKNCLGEISLKSFSKLISLNKKKNDVILMQVKKYEAPIFLRKYIYDYVNNNGLINAEEECQKITEQEPYVSYRKICNLLK